MRGQIFFPLLASAGCWEGQLKKSGLPRVKSRVAVDTGEIWHRLREGVKTDVV